MDCSPFTTAFNALLFTLLLQAVTATARPLDTYQKLQTVWTQANLTLSEQRAFKTDALKNRTIRALAIESLYKNHPEAFHHHLAGLLADLSNPETRSLRVLILRKSGLDKDTTDILSHYFTFLDNDALPGEKTELINKLAMTLGTTPGISNLLSNTPKRDRLINLIARSIMTEQGKTVHDETSTGLLLSTQLKQELFLIQIEKSGKLSANLYKPDGTVEKVVQESPDLGHIDDQINAIAPHMTLSYLGNPRMILVGSSEQLGMLSPTQKSPHTEDGFSERDAPQEGTEKNTPHPNKESQKPPPKPEENPFYKGRYQYWPLNAISNTARAVRKPLLNYGLTVGGMIVNETLSLGSYTLTAAYFPVYAAYNVLYFGLDLLGVLDAGEWLYNSGHSEKKSWESSDQDDTW